MTPSDLLFTLIDLGVHFSVVEDSLVYKAPVGTMTPELVEQLKEHKAEVVGLVVRRMCATCGSAGRCEGRVPMTDGGWSCQAALDAGLLSDRGVDRRRHRRQSRARQPFDARERRHEMAVGQASPPPATASTGCGEKVPVRTADGLAWVRCTGPETCDGVCTQAGRDARTTRGMEAAS